MLIPSANVPYGGIDAGDVSRTCELGVLAGGSSAVWSLVSTVRPEGSAQQPHGRPVLRHRGPGAGQDLS
jgi:hypothetical protein